MPRLIWVFPGRSHFAGFVMRWLIYWESEFFRFLYWYKCTSRGGKDAIKGVGYMISPKVFCFILNLQYFLFISSGTIYLLYLGDNCIQNVNLGRYIISYMVVNFVLNVISDHITDDIPPQMKILLMVIPILIHFLTFIHQRHSILHQTKALSAMYNNYVNQSQATSLMMLVLWRYITECTGTNSWRYPIRCRVTFASALEWIFTPHA